MTFLDDALKMPSADSNIFVDDILLDIFQAQLKHVENSFRSGKYKGEVLNNNASQIIVFTKSLLFFQAKFIGRNASFLLHTVLALAQLRVSEVRLHPCPSFSKLRSEFEWLAYDSQKITTTIKSPVSDQSFI